MKFRHTNFMRLIYATLLALPFVAILSRVIYVQSNKNAYQSAEITQSFNGYTRSETYQTNNVNDVNDIHVGNIYQINYTDYIDLNSSEIYYSYIKFLTPESIFFQNTSRKYFLVNDSTYLYIRSVAISGGSSTLDYLINKSVVNQGNYILAVPYEINNYTYNNNFQAVSENDMLYTYTETEITGTTLDNVFEYSVNKFIENNNFGKINLFQWTTNLFFDSNDVNNMYVGFINWYLNYTLLVSATYILFLVLMWFINYARRLLERGMNYDW